MNGLLVIFFCLVTWFITMNYYTERFKVKLFENNLSTIQCSHCSTELIFYPENIRTPMYCNKCK